MLSRYAVIELPPVCTRYSSFITGRAPFQDMLRMMTVSDEFLRDLHMRDVATERKRSASRAATKCVAVTRAILPACVVFSRHPLFSARLQVSSSQDTPLGELQGANTRAARAQPCGSPAGRASAAGHLW